MTEVSADKMILLVPSLKYKFKELKYEIMPGTGILANYQGLVETRILEEPLQRPLTKHNP